MQEKKNDMLFHRGSTIKFRMLIVNIYFWTHVMLFRTTYFELTFVSAKSKQGSICLLHGHLLRISTYCTIKYPCNYFRVVRESDVMEFMSFSCIVI